MFGRRVCLHSATFVDWPPRQPGGQPFVVENCQGKSNYKTPKFLMSWNLKCTCNGGVVDCSSTSLHVKGQQGQYIYRSTVLPYDYCKARGPEMGRGPTTLMLLDPRSEIPNQAETLPQRSHDPLRSLRVVFRSEGNYGTSSFQKATTLNQKTS